jgi:hypothetical protein
VTIGHGPSIQGLDNLYRDLLAAQAQRGVLWSAKIVIDEIQRQAAGGMAIGVAVEDVERTWTRSCMSLHKLSKFLSGQRNKNVYYGRREIIIDEMM